MTNKVMKINRIMEAMEDAGYLLAAVDTTEMEIKAPYEEYVTEQAMEHIAAMYFVEASDEAIENGIDLDEVEYIKVVIEK